METPCVALKICQNMADMSIKDITTSTGALIGLNDDSTLYITNSFQFPKTNLQTYNTEITRALDKLEVESNVVGLYTALMVDSFISEDFLNKLYLYQSTIHECVVLVYDYVKFMKGVPSIKAYRLTPDALELLRSNDFSATNIRKTIGSFDKLLISIPVFVRSSTLTRILLRKLRPVIPYPADSISFRQDELLDKKIYFLIRGIKDLAYEAYKLCQKGKRIHHQYITYEGNKDLKNSSDLDTGDPTGRAIDLNLDHLNMVIGCWNTKYLVNEAKGLMKHLNDSFESFERMTTALND